MHVEPMNMLELISVLGSMDQYSSVTHGLCHSTSFPEMSTTEVLVDRYCSAF